MRTLPIPHTHTLFLRLSSQSIRVVGYAIAANVLVMIGKFGASYATGSASMMSEGIHSLADVANQVCVLGWALL